METLAVLQSEYTNECEVANYAMLIRMHSNGIVAESGDITFDS
jgi:hypothetical protein